MPTYAVKQPNGNYALFSTVVDDFTAHSLTREEATLLLSDRGMGEALSAMKRADEDKLPGGHGNAPSPQEFRRWYDALDTVQNIHGKKKRAEAERWGARSPRVIDESKAGDRVFMGWVLKNGHRYLVRESCIDKFIPVGPRLAVPTIDRGEAESWRDDAHKQGLTGARLVRVFRTVR